MLGRGRSPRPGQSRARVRYDTASFRDDVVQADSYRASLSANVASHSLAISDTHAVLVVTEPGDLVQACCCAPAPPGSASAPTRSCATPSPGACWACPPDPRPDRDIPFDPLDVRRSLPWNS